MRRDNKKQSSFKRGRDPRIERSATSRPAPKLESILFGRKPVLELLRKAPERIVKLFIADTLRASGELSKQLQGYGGQIKYLPTEELDHLVDGEFHQGVVAETKPRAAKSLADLIAAAGDNSVVVVLDQIGDPQNLGAIIRTCDAANVLGIVATTDRSASLTGAAKKASAGASEFVDVVFVTNLSRAIDELREAGFWVMGTAGEAKDSIFTAQTPEKLAVVFGSEGEGMRRLTRDKCDFLVHIPIYGAVESLNVSQAVTAVLFELIRRRAAGLSGRK